MVSNLPASKFSIISPFRFHQSDATVVSLETPVFTKLHLVLDFCVFKPARLRGQAMYHLQRCGIESFLMKTTPRTTVS